MTLSISVNDAQTEVTIITVDATSGLTIKKVLTVATGLQNTTVTTSLGTTISTTTQTVDDSGNVTTRKTMELTGDYVYSVMSSSHELVSTKTSSTDLTTMINTLAEVSETTQIVTITNILENVNLFTKITKFNEADKTRTVKTTYGLTGDSTIEKINAASGDLMTMTRHYSDSELLSLLTSTTSDLSTDIVISNSDSVITSTSTAYVGGDLNGFIETYALTENSITGNQFQTTLLMGTDVVMKYDIIEFTASGTLIANISFEINVPIIGQSTTISINYISGITINRVTDSITGDSTVITTVNGIVTLIVLQSSDGSVLETLYPLPFKTVPSLNNYTYVKKFVGNSTGFSVAQRRRFDAITKEKTINKINKIFTRNDAFDISSTEINHYNTELVKQLRRR
jgi:hypothetical protein